jgi:Flp pilus assembly pilin Flp
MLKNLSDWMVRAYVKKQEDARDVMDRVIGNQRGAGAVEYGLVIAVVVVMVIVAANQMSGPLNAFFQKVVQTVTDMF